MPLDRSKRPPQKWSLPFILSNNNQNMDPPERSYQNNPNPAPLSRSLDPPDSSSDNLPSFADDHLDEYELEGLMMTPVRSSVGAGKRSLRSNRGYFTFLASPLIGLYTLAWEPRNRIRSSLTVLVITLLLLIYVSNNDKSAWQRVHLSDREGKHTKRTSVVQDPIATLTPEQRTKLLTRIYGAWNFYDGSAEDRPTEPYLTPSRAGKYLDMKSEDFPEESWQVDAVYVNHFLDAATKLVRRGQEAIFAEYNGHGIEDITVEEVDGDVYGEVSQVDERLTRRHDMFKLSEVDLTSVKTAKELKEKASWENRGGWTTSRSMDGLERRFLHAMMTNSKFTIVVTGSWQSMGYGGNHGWQSMAGVLDRLLSSLFEKLGMELVVRAVGLPPKTGIGTREQAEMFLGGRSTLESSLGWSSIYGSDVDMVVWDDYSAIPDEHGEYTQELDDTAAELFDFFARQALLSGPTNLPFLFGGDFNVLRNLHEFADVDVGQLGNGMAGVPQTTSESQAFTLPWASQYLDCSPKMQKICDSNEIKFASQCWDSSLKSTPPQPQSSTIPALPTAMGWRMHQLKGYTLGYNLLAALLDSLDVWSEKTIYEGHPLADENWHMEEHITNIQTKVQSLTESNAPHCYKLDAKLNIPKRLCNHRMQGRTEYTPRANPEETSLQSVVVASSGNIPSYELQSVFETASWQPIVEDPANSVTALEILELGKQSSRRLEPHQLKQRRLAIKTGDGWKIIDSFPPKDCNGIYSPNSSCGRVSTSTCVLEGHQGSFGYVSGDEKAGWLSMKINGVEFGYVAINLKIGDVGDQTKSLEERLPESFTLSYAVDETTTALSKAQFIQKLKVFNGMGLLTILDDENQNLPKDVKISVQVSGCSEDDCRLSVSHLYWS